MVDTLLEEGIRVPEDISVICSDNTLATVKGKVKLTCVSYNDRLMGNAAGDLLLERLNNPNMQKKRVVYCPFITSRESVKKLENI
jgi:DNA-binding LacI/PurR family transcriptional regulator